MKLLKQRHETIDKMSKSLLAEPQVFCRKVISPVKCLIFVLTFLALNGSLNAEGKDSLWTVSFGDFTIVEPIDPGEKLLEGNRITTENEVQGLSDGLEQVIQNHTQAHVRNYGVGSSASIALRGSAAAHTEVYWNGINLNSPTHGQSDLSLIPSFFFDEMEMSHGISSLMEGAGAIGGLINLDQEGIPDDGKNVELTSSGGSYGNYRNKVVGSMGNEKVRGRVRLYQHSARNDFSYKNTSKPDNPTESLDNAALSQYGIMGEGELEISENSQIGVNQWYFDSDRELPSPIHVQSREEEQTDRNYRGVVNYQFQNEDHTFRSMAGYVDDYLLYINPSSDIYSETEVSRFIGGSDYSYSQGDFRLGAGVKGQINKAVTEGYPDGVRRDVLSSRANLFYQLTSDIHGGIVLRQELSNRETSPLLPGLVLSWRLLRGHPTLTLTAEASRNYKEPSLNDLYWEPGGNPDLQPEQSRELEMGLDFRHTLFDQRLTLTNETNVFYREVENKIVWEPGVSGNWGAQGFSEVFSNGLENHLTAQVNFEELEVGLRGVYAFTNSLTGENENQLIYLPRNTLRGNLFGKWNDWEFSLSSTYTGRQYLNSSNTRYLPGYELFHSGISRSFEWGGHSFNTGINLRNVMDKDYQTIANRPMPGRHFEVFLSLDLGI